MDHLQNINMEECLLCNKIIKDLDKHYRTANGVVCNECAEEIFSMANGLTLVDPVEDMMIEASCPKPKELYNKLNEYVIGQDDAKKTLSIAVYNHYKRLRSDKIDKSNILMIGPSGSGKTLLCKTLAKFLSVPFVICDATTFTQAGYIGEDVESMLTKLYIESGYDIKSTEKGIIFIDEIDKISEVKTMGRDASGLGVQQALLKFLEGSKVTVPTKLGKQQNCETIVIDTDNILFICSGAFVNLKEHSIDGLIDFGLIPELIGRLPIIVETKELSQEDIKRIITEPKNNILDQYKELFRLDGIELVFNEDALELIYKACYENKLGARGIRSVFEAVLKDSMFNSPGKKKKVIVTKTTVNNSLKLYNENFYIKNDK